MEIFELLKIPSIQRAFWIAVLVGPVAGLLGVFITLRRMSIFSDSISHGAMAGLALGMFLKIIPDIDSPNLVPVLVVWCVITAIAVVRLMETTTLPADTILAFASTGSVALAAVLIQKLKGYQMLENALFGNILASSQTDLWLIVGLCLILVLFLLFNLRALTLSTVQESLARLEKIPIQRLNYIFVALVAVTVALLLRQLGGMLISGLIVIPAAASRSIARSFSQMLLLAAVFGFVGAVSGFWISCEIEDVPTAPSMVLCELAILAGCLGIAAVSGHRKPPKLTEPAGNS